MVDEPLSPLVAKGANHVMSLLVELIRRREVKGEDAQLLVLAAEMDKAGDRQSKEKRGAGRGEGRQGEEGRGEVRRAVKGVGKNVDKVKRGSAAWTRGFWPCWRRRKASTKA
jgi:hypothetical protein